MGKGWIVRGGTSLSLSMAGNCGRVDMAMRVGLSTPGNEYLLDPQKRLDIEESRHSSVNRL